MENEWTQEEEASRLEQRFIELKRKKISQAAFARELGIRGGASMVNQHIKAHRPINLASAIAYAKGFGCSLEEISPRLAREVRDAGGSGAELPITAELTEKLKSHSDENNTAASLLLGMAGILKPLSPVLQDFAIKLIAEAVKSPDLAAAHAVRLEGLLNLEGRISEVAATGSPEESLARVRALWGPTKKAVPNDEDVSTNKQGKGE